MAGAVPVLADARQALRRVAGRQRGLLRKAINELGTLMTRAIALVAQTRRRVAWEKIDSATRVVSLHEPDARPIKKGRLGKPVEFGSKAQVMDNEDGLILDYEVKTGNPPDGEQLARAISRVHKRLGRRKRALPVVPAERVGNLCRVHLALLQADVMPLGMSRHLLLPSASIGPL